MQDIRNSTTAIIDETFTAKKYYKYGSFGKAVEKGSSTFKNDNTYTGAISEGDGIYYMNARFYDSNTGRFLTQDTYRGNMYEPWSQHLYTYCGNNPVNYVAPTGHYKIPNWLKNVFKVFSKTKNISDTNKDANDAMEDVTKINQYTQFDLDNTENAYREGQSPESVYLLPVPIIDYKKKDNPDLSEAERAEIYAKEYRDSLSSAIPGSSTGVYRKSWDVLKNIDLQAELIKNGSGSVSTPFAFNNAYFFAIEKAGKGKAKTDFIMIWGYMGAEKDEK